MMLAWGTVQSSFIFQGAEMAPNFDSGHDSTGRCATIFSPHCHKNLARLSRGRIFSCVHISFDHLVLQI